MCRSKHGQEQTADINELNVPRGIASEWMEKIIVTTMRRSCFSLNVSRITSVENSRSSHCFSGENVSVLPNT